MIESQTLNPEILNVTEDVTFTPLEWKYFVLELKDMMARAARFYAEIERSDNSFKAGHYVKFTDEEWQKFIADEDWEKHLNEQTV